MGELYCSASWVLGWLEPSNAKDMAALYRFGEILAAWRILGRTVEELGNYMSRHTDDEIFSGVADLTPWLDTGREGQGLPMNDNWQDVIRIFQLKYWFRIWIL